MSYRQGLSCSSYSNAAYQTSGSANAQYLVQNFQLLPSRPLMLILRFEIPSIRMKILKKMKQGGEKARSSFESFKTEMLERDSENKRPLDLLNEQLEINEQKM